MRAVRLTTADTVKEPVTVADLTDFGRVTYVDQPVALERMIRAARVEVERFAGVVMVPGTFLIHGDRWASVFDLPLRPITAVTSFQYIDESGVSTPLTTDQYVLDLATESSRIVLTRTAPTPYALRPVGGVEIEVTAGYTAPADIPEDIRQHVLTLALLMYEHRADPDMLVKVRDYAGYGARAFVAGELV